MTGADAKLRLDKWLWYARFFKTRSLASRQVTEGRVRVNGQRATKPAQTVAAGDVLTFAQANAVRVVRIVDLGSRRGPAPEAQTLYDDMTETEAPQSPRTGPRPTKKDRRALDSWQKS